MRRKDIEVPDFTQIDLTDWPAWAAIAILTGMLIFAALLLYCILTVAQHMEEQAAQMTPRPIDLNEYRIHKSWAEQAKETVRYEQQTMKGGEAGESPLQVSGN